MSTDMAGSPLKRAKREMMAKLELRVGSLGVSGPAGKVRQNEPETDEPEYVIGPGSTGMPSPQHQAARESLDPDSSPMRASVLDEPPLSLLEAWVSLPSPWMPIFLTALRNSGNVRYACEVANVARSTVYRAQDSSEEFKQQFDLAFEDAVDLLEGRAWTMARVDPNMVRFLLQAHRPEVYARTLNVKHGGDRDNPIQHQHAHAVAVYLPDNSRGDGSAKTTELLPAPTGDNIIDQVVQEAAEEDGRMVGEEPDLDEPDLDDEEDI